MIRIMIAILFFLSSALSIANEVSIEQVVFHKQSDSWNVDTTLLHQDSGWDHYADAWRVVDDKGNELGQRILFHPHENEQPFTRSLQGLKIPQNMTVIYVEAHDKVHGWSQQKVRVDLTQDKGERFSVRR